ncbi:MAG: VOC family protein [Nostoc sp.]
MLGCSKSPIGSLAHPHPPQLIEDSDMDNNPSILSHVSIGTNDFERAIAFYDAVLPTLGCKRFMEHPGAIAYGKQYPEFWVGTPFDGQPPTVGNGTHIGLYCSYKRSSPRLL